MNDEMKIGGIIILVLIYFGVTLFLIFGKKISIPKFVFFSRSRKKTFMAADILLFVIYILGIIILINYWMSSAMVFLFILIIFALFSLLRAVEEYVTNKETKGYYHKWADFILCIIALFIWTL